MSQKIFIAVAWPYASGSRHLGHVAGFGVPSDIFARYHRLKGNQVLMVSGTDDHGTPITVRADKEGKTPQEIVDYYHREITDNLAQLGCSYTLFTQTTTANHYAVVQDIFLRLNERGHLIRQTMRGTYCETDRRFLPDRYVEGECPHCAYGDARGDQCDNCGRQLDPTDLIRPRCKVCGHPASFRDTDHYFLNLPAFADRIRAWVEQQPHWRQHVRNFTLGLLNEGLKPRPITRDLEWGVPIPLDDPAMAGKRIYVWFDAVIGYLSATIEWAKNNGRPEAWKEWWFDPNVRHYYFMGKDNITFHTVIWPSILMGYGNYNLPYDVVSSEFLTMEGKRFSASRGIGITLPYFFSRYDTDPLRYILTINGPETADTDFTWAEFIRRNNDELVATWGNLANRVLTFTHKHFGVVPTPGPLDDIDQAILNTTAAAFASVGGHLEAARFKAGLTEAMAVAQAANKYLDTRAPWLTLKTDRERTATTLWVILRVIDSLKILLAPFLPFTCQQLHHYLGYNGTISGGLYFREISEPGRKPHRVLTCEPAATDQAEPWEGRWQPSELPAGQMLRPPAPLFKKLDPAIAEEEVARMMAEAG